MTGVGAAARDVTSPLHEYLRVVRERWIVILIVFVITVMSAVVFTMQQTKIYQASATVLIEPEPPRVVNIPEVANDASSAGALDYYPTQYKILQSRPVVEAVIRRLDLKRRIPALGASVDPYGTFIGKLSVDPVKNTRLVLVRFEDRDGALAADVANAVASQYVQYGLDVKQAEAKTAATWLAEQIQVLRTKQQESSDALQRYQAKADLLGLQDQRQVTQAKLIDFNRAYLEAQNQRVAAESKLRELSRIAKDPAGSESVSIVANDPLIQKLKTEASDLQIERSKLAQVSREKHPDLLQLDAQIREVNQRLQTEVQKLLRAVETEYKVARGREEALLANVNELRHEARRLNEREAQASSLQREKDSVDELQGTVLKRLKETGLTSALGTTNIRIMEQATVPTVPIKPRTLLITTLAAIAGLALGLGVAFVSDSLDNRVHSAEDIERILGVPILGTVPVFRGRRND